MITSIPPPVFSNKMNTPMKPKQKHFRSYSAQFSTFNHPKFELPVDVLAFHKINERTEFNCPICYMEVKRPTQCTKCKHLFCTPCLSNWKKIHYKCPMCKSFWLTPKPHEIFSMAYFAIVNGSQNTSCNYCLDKCPQTDFEKHIKSCQNIVKCQFCFEQVSKVTKKSHFKQCPNYPVKCQFCTTKVKRKEMGTHITVCPEKPTKCGFCTRKFKQSAIDIHKCAIKTCKVCGEVCSVKEYKRHVEKHQCSKCKKNCITGKPVYCKCKQRLCQDCAIKCNSCDKVHCIECTRIKKCDKCELNKCHDCLKNCRLCKKVVCKSCNPKFEISRCLQCRTRKCNDCIASTGKCLNCY